MVGVQPNEGDSLLGTLIKRTMEGKRIRGRPTIMWMKKEDYRMLKERAGQSD